MKKVILSLVAAAFSTTMLMAQPPTNVQNAQNLPTAFGQGFEFKFMGAPIDNCAPATLPSPGNNIWNTFGTPNYMINFSGNNPIIQANGTAGSGLLSIRLPQLNCGNVGTGSEIDCSGNKKIQMTVISNVVVPKFSVMFAADNGGFSVVDGNATDPRTTTALVIGTNTFTVTSPTHDFNSNVFDLTKILGLSFVIRDASDVSMAANITITSIKIGDAVTTTGTLAAVNNSLISVYPNPAKDQINIDLTSMNSASALVKITNSNGAVVYQGTASNTTEVINTSAFNKGIYMVQVSSDNNVSNKKVVIE